MYVLKTPGRSRTPIGVFVPDYGRLQVCGVTREEVLAPRESYEEYDHFWLLNYCCVRV